MSGQTRQKLLVELSAISLAGGTNQVVKDNLEITDTDLSGVEADIGALEIRMDQVEIDLPLLETTVENVSANLSTDIDNLDLAFTQLISEEVWRSDNPAITGSSVGDISGSDLRINGFINMNINGVTYKIPTVEEI